MLEDRDRFLEDSFPHPGKKRKKTHGFSSGQGNVSSWDPGSNFKANDISKLRPQTELTYSSVIDPNSQFERC